MKLFKILIAALVMAAMVTPAIASDLKLSGSMEVRGYYLNVDDGTDDTTENWNYQRLRTAGTYSVADGVSVHFRFDVTESEENSSGTAPWGGDEGQYTQRRADIQYDLAYLQLVKNGITFKAGELYTGRFGIGKLSDALGAGFVVSANGVTAYHIKQNEDDLGFGGDENSLSGLVYSLKGDGFTLTPSVAYTNNGGGDADVFGAMLAFTADAGGVKLKGEFDMFDGEDASGNDVKGEQLYLDASVAASDSATVGGMILWANAQDGGDVQVSSLAGTGFGGWSPFQFGHNATDFAVDVDEFEIDTNAGIRALSLYAVADVSEDVNVQAAIAYAEADDDGISDIEATILNASASYAILPNTALKFSANYMDIEEGGTDEDIIQGIGGVYVKF